MNNIISLLRNVDTFNLGIEALKAQSSELSDLQLSLVIAKSFVVVKIPARPKYHKDYTFGSNRIYNSEIEKRHITKLYMPNGIVIVIRNPYDSWVPIIDFFNDNMTALDVLHYNRKWPEDIKFMRPIHYHWQEFIGETPNKHQNQIDKFRENLIAYIKKHIRTKIY